MSWLGDRLTFQILWVLLWGLGLGFLHFAVFLLLEVLPLGDDRRASLARLKSLVGVSLALVFSLFSAHTLFAPYPQVLPIALLLVPVAFFVGSRSLVRDFFAGVALRAEQSIQVGDHIRVGETSGRITELGPRAISLATPEGDSALLPYSQAAQRPIVRTKILNRRASRTFTVEAAASTSFASVSREVQRAALLHHWGSIAQPPEVSAAPDGSIEVTVFALAQDHTDDLERAVRKAIESAVAPSASRP